MVKAQIAYDIMIFGVLHWWNYQTKWHYSYNIIAFVVLLKWQFIDHDKILLVTLKYHIYHDELNENEIEGSLINLDLTRNIPPNCVLLLGYNQLIVHVFGTLIGSIQLNFSPIPIPWLFFFLITKTDLGGPIPLFDSSNGSPLLFVDLSHNQLTGEIPTSPKSLVRISQDFVSFP